MTFFPTFPAGMWKTFPLLALLLLFAPPLAAETDPVSAPAVSTTGITSPQEVLAYAHSLERQRDHRRAAGEYGRLIHHARRHPRRPAPWLEEALFKRAVNLQLADEPERALRAFSGLGATFPNSRHIPEALYRMGRIHEKNGHSDLAQRRYRSLMNRAHPLADAARLRLAGLTLQEGSSVDKVPKYLKKITSPDYRRQADAILAALPERAGLTHKDPHTAGVLSAIVPGSGHLYLDRPRDALFAFLSNALLITGTVQAFREDISGLGAALAVIELGWYTGTIYSSVSLAHKHNRQVDQAWLDRLRPHLQPRADAATLGLSLDY